MSSKMPGKLFVLSASSGTGKTTLARKLLAEDKNIQVSVSCTTRLARLGEKNGIDYYFLNQQQFRQKIRRKEFLEWAHVFGYYYGTPKDKVVASLREGKDMLLVIDVQGAKQVKRSMPEAVFIFLAPPSMTELKRRLTLRGTDSKTEIAKRFRMAKEELKTLNELFLFDYRIVNNDLGRALKALQGIVIAERS